MARRSEPSPAELAQAERIVAGINKRIDQALYPLLTEFRVMAWSPAHQAVALEALLFRVTQLLAEARAKAGPDAT